MSTNMELTAADGHRLGAYRAAPNGRPLGAVVVIHEIFGVTGHVRHVTDELAEAGFLAIAPALFDRVQRGTQLPYANIPAGRALVDKLKLDQTMTDVAAAIGAARQGGRVAIMGFCWGGTIAYLAAGSRDVVAAVSYYGARIASFLDRQPKVPTLYHFGERDQHIPLQTVEQIRAAHPDGIYHLYPAGHGFNCDERADYEPKSAALAWQRSLDFLKLQLS
jgi:carboxymethylenebutenolidase